MSIKSAVKQAYYGYRKMTSSLRSLPDFLIIGTQKGGTTSLYSYLSYHPRVREAYSKEVHYFDNQYKNGQSWYRANFPYHTRKLVTGESSPYYLYHPHVPERVYKAVPKCKPIVLLRNPVERAYSHYNMGNRVVSGPRESFEEAISLEESRIREDWNKMVDNPSLSLPNVQDYSYLDRGNYLEQILRWEKYFPREQFLILPSEQFFQDPQEVTRITWEFLGLRPVGLTDLPVRNQGAYKSSILPETKERLTAHFAPKNQALFNHLGQSFDW